MNAIFLAYGYRPRVYPLAAQVERLVRSHGLAVKDGRILGGDALTPAVQGLIDSSDGLIALLTQGDQGVGATFPWVVNELDYARQANMECIGLVEDGVNAHAGMYQNRAHIDYKPIGAEALLPAEALLALSENLGLWKSRAGRTLRAQLLPAALALRFDPDDQFTRWLFRTSSPAPAVSPWRKATPVRQPGGEIVIYLAGVVGDEHNIELRIETPGSVWQSNPHAQWIKVELAPMQMAGAKP